MKKTIFILVAVIFTSVLFSSCKNEPNNPKAITKENLSGKWNVKEGFVNEKWTEVSDLGWYAQFNANGSYKAKMTDEYRGTWILEDEQIICDIYGFKVFYDIIEFNGNDAIVDMRYQGELGKLRLKVVRE